MYGYVRFETGDEMSRRAKFALITWIGPNVSPLKKAKVSTDKAFVKRICPVSLYPHTHTHMPYVNVIYVVVCDYAAIWQRDTR